MALWLVRAGKYGEEENFAVDNKVAVIGWGELPDLSQVTAREQLGALLRDTYPNAKPRTLANWESQIWPFLRVIEAGDLIALPLKTRPAVAIGRVTGPYRHRPELPQNARHTRPVEWLGEYSRTTFGQDLLYSLGAFMTVCRIQRNRAEERVKAILAGQPDRAASLKVSPAEEGTDSQAMPDLEEYARDQIRTYIAQNFRGHELAHLVARILETQGYQTQVSPEGPDGGVDIIAGRGPLGFDPPRLAVQVKSSDSQVDVKILRELQGVMKNFGAEHGLVVAWGGFKPSVVKEAARSYFEIRLWDSDDLVRMIQSQYDQLPESVRAELPLKRIWTLVPSED